MNRMDRIVVAKKKRCKRLLSFKFESGRITLRILQRHVNRKYICRKLQLKALKSYIKLTSSSIEYQFDSSIYGHVFSGSK